MNLKLPLTLALSTGLLLSGCAETKTFGTSIVQTASSVVNAAVSGTVEGIKRGMSGTSETSNHPKSNTLPSSDMVYLLGWMEDGCLGDANQAYIQLSDRYFDAREQLIEYKLVPELGEYGYVPSPRSKWPTVFRESVKDIHRIDSTDFTDAFKITFKDNVRYRGQPLQAHIFQFIEGTDATEFKLVFSPNADVHSIWPNFYTKEYDPHWGDSDKVYTSGAIFRPQSNTIICSL